MKKVILVVILGIFVCGIGYAQDIEKKAAGTPVKVNNTICPVSGDKVNMKNPATVEYNGEIYNLCCPMCTPEFNKNPEKYSAKAKGK